MRMKKMRKIRFYWKKMGRIMKKLILIEIMFRISIKLFIILKRKMIKWKNMNEMTNLSFKAFQTPK